MALSFMRLSIPKVAGLSLPANPVSIVEMKDGGFLLNFAATPEVIRLDPGLKEVWRKDLQAQSIQYSSCNLSVSPDQEVMALSGSSDIRLLDKDGNLLHTIFHRSWYHFLGTNCFFTADNRYALYVLPGADDNEDDLLQLLRLSDFKMLDEVVIDGSNQRFHYTLIATPDEDKIMISAAAGQDDGTLYQVQLIGDKIVLERLEQCNDRIFGSFSPDGSTFVTVPHYEEAIEIFTFPIIEKIAGIQQLDIFSGRDEYFSKEESDSLDYVVFYLKNECLLAFTRFGRLLLIDTVTLQCKGELLLADCEIRAYDIAGLPTTNKNDIVDYGGDIVTFFLTKRKQLLITHNSGEIRLYHFEDVIW